MKPALPPTTSDRDHCPWCKSRNRVVRLVIYMAKQGGTDIEEIACFNPWHDEQVEEQHHENRLILALHKIFNKLQEILVVETEIRDLLLPRPTRLHVIFGGTMPLAVGSTTTATVTVLDQNGAAMPYDFVTNVPQWTADANASFAPGANPGEEVFTGVSAGTENWSVTVPGVANPTASGSFEVTAVVTQVATSVSVSFNPPVV